MRQFSRRRTLAYSMLIVGSFFGLLELGLRVVGVGTPPRPRLILRAIDEDIDFPFMRPDPEVFWSPRPGWRGDFLGQAVSINSLGLRAPELARPKPATRRRIACFGDSITFGYGVADGETYPARLHARLAEGGIDVVNAGVTGYTSYQVRRLLDRVLPAVEPDIVTVCIGWNDGTLRPLSDRQYASRVQAAMAVEGVLDRLYLFRAARSLYTRTRLSAGARSDHQPRVDPLRYRENLREIVARCRAGGSRPVFLALPRRYRSGEPAPPSPYPDLLSASAAELGVPLIAAPPLTMGSPREGNEAYFIDTLHLSASGNDRMAAAVRDGLEGLGYLP